MDAVDARELLNKIKQASVEGFSGITGWLPTFGKDPKADQFNQEIQQIHNAKLQSDAMKTILKTMLISGGVGAAVRGYTGLADTLSKKKRKTTGRVVEMPVAYPEKLAGNEQATSMIGLNYFAPAMMLGAPLAAYGGWKGVDAILNRQRKKAMEEELEKAKAKYEQALLGSYKQAVDEALTVAFQPYEKQAILPEMVDMFNSKFPNVSGASQGLALAYALASAPLGYHMVDRVMKKNSKRALLQKAMEERARRQAKEQPPEIYAVPTPVAAE